MASMKRPKVLIAAFQLQDALQIAGLRGWTRSDLAMYLLLYGLFAFTLTWKLFYEGFQTSFQRRRETPLSPFGFLPTFLIVLSLLIGFALLIRSIPHLNPIE